ncbi:AfsA-related hotdog domain-containing protein [Nocardia sp. NPDC049526]|uniref:AfsA-related hotdog domain-containing protein n=1 Tax=Nocardia sp. NPDC049526 TaxID=3364316 RepID=UPI0037ACA119
MNRQTRLAADAGLSFEQTVPRTLAHRANLGEVLVADSARLGADEFVVAFQVPRAHLLWADRIPHRHDAFAAAEAARQACFVVIHRHLEIPVGTPFTMHSFRFEAEEPAAFRDDRRTALEGVFQYRVARSTNRGANQGDLSFEGIALIGGEPAMSFAGEVVFLAAADYQALRSYQRSRRPVVEAAPAPVPVSATAVGRTDGRNVVIGESNSAWPQHFPIIVDRSHPSYFDHDYDHLPGPLCVEAFRQASIVVAGAAGHLPDPAAAFVTAASAVFTDFAEIDSPAACSVVIDEVGPDGEIETTVGLHQFGKSIAEGTLTLLPG